MKNLIRFLLEFIYFIGPALLAIVILVALSSCVSFTIPFQGI